MQKKTLKIKNIFLLLVVMAGSLSGLFFFTPTPAKAAYNVGNNLNQIAEKCFNFEKDSALWKTCEADQASNGKPSNLVLNGGQTTVKDVGLGCSDTMFYYVPTHPNANDQSITVNKYYTTATKYLDCTNKAQAAVDKIKSSYCASTRHNPGNSKADSPAWKNCEKAQYNLYAGLGCSQYMFEEIPNKSGYWRPNAGNLADCQKRVDIAKNAQLTDSTGKKTTAATAAAPPANAGGGGVQPDGGSTADSNNDTPCHGGALGWVLCPLVNVMADGVRAIASFIDGTLQFKILANNSQGTGGGIKDYWGRFVGLANILLVIAFLFIIYSQATGAGLSNYGIKRMLPRIVLGAILINLSFYICALAIDATNIIGNAVLGFFTGDSQGISDGLAKQAGLTGPGGFQSGVGATLGAAIGVVLIVLFFTPLLLGVLVTFILLIARQVILIALVMVSPLAFAAYLLPNTEEYFKKWRKIFTDMLVAYPVIMAVFGVSLFASKVIGDISTQTTTNSTDLITNGTVSYIVSLVILAVPLLALPFLLKSASGSLAKVAGQFDRFKQQSGLEAGLNKVQGGLKKRGAAYGGLAGKGAAVGAGKLGTGFQRSRFGQKLGQTPLGSGGARVRRAAGNVLNADRGVMAAKEARKQQRESGRRERMAEFVSGDSLAARALQGYGGNSFVAAAAGVEEEERRKRVSAHEAMLGRSDIGADANGLGDALTKAITDGDHDKSTAIVNRLAKLGAGGAEELSARLQGGHTTKTDANGNKTTVPVQGVNVQDANMQKTLSRAVMEDNYGALVEKSGDIAKGGFRQDGSFGGNFHSLSTQQVAGLSAGAMSRYATEIDGQRAVAADVTRTQQDRSNAQAQVDRASAHHTAVAANPALQSRIADPSAKVEFDKTA